MTRRLTAPLHGVLTAAALALGSVPALAAADARITELAAQQKQPLLDTLAQLVGDESGSRNLAGLDQLAQLIAERLRALGGQVELIEPGSPGGPEVYRMDDTPEKLGKVVRATFKGTGSRKIMLIAHMDTVYDKGMLAKQRNRIDGNRAYGLGIADDKQGIAVILHAVAMLQQMGVKDYGQLTVLINGDEEISSPGSRQLISQLAAEHDAVLSHEAAPSTEDKLSLATAGIGAVSLKVQGKASHAGSAPERGVNAFYEMAHQVLQTRDLSDPATGLKLNWTLGEAGNSRNGVIPAQASATADVRVTKVADYERVERALEERVKKQLIPEAKVEMRFERRRPPLESNPGSLALARHAQAVCRAGPPAGRRRQGGWRRRRRCVRGGVRQGGGGRALWPAGLWRAFGRRRVRADRLDRAAPVPHHPPGDRRGPGQGAAALERPVLQFSSRIGCWP